MAQKSLQCVGFIMDGNRRWAKERGLPTVLGHQQGSECFTETIKWVQEAKIPHAVYYAFSTENWKRSDEEVGYLMGLFRELLAQFMSEAKTKGETIQIRVVGRRSDFAAEMQAQIDEIEKRSHGHQGASTTIWIALSYGGRAEVIEAANLAVTKGQMLTEESFEQLLWTADMPDPDLIIRTGGEYRLSNFMTWKSVYSELFFLDTHWPALTKDDFDGILMQYAARERRKGG
jgi:undecaprenyl diphosphate synthase